MPSPETAHYFDHAATAPLAPEVQEAMRPYLGERFGNASTIYPLGVEAAYAVERARLQVLRALHADEAQTRVVFTGSATEAINLAHTLGQSGGGKVRLRWQAEHPGALWHGDVCHGAPLGVGETKKPVRIHALLDDASRYVVAIEAMTSERELDMLSLFVRALRRHGPPDALYLDNGSTYRGQTLHLACERLGTTLIHARPYDAPARGKMERFWRTLREGCLHFTGALSTLQELNARLYAWVDQHYHVSAHAALFGKSPAQVYEEGPREVDDIDERRLRDALTVHARRRVRRDNTLAMDGEDWETDLGYLAGRLVTVSRCLVEPEAPPWLEHEGKRYLLRPVDPVRNGRRPRPACNLDTPHVARVPFDPPSTLLDKAVGRVRRPAASKEDA